MKDRYNPDNIETSGRDSIQSMINDTIRQTSSNTSSVSAFGIQKSDKEELVRIAKNTSGSEKFKQKFNSLGMKSRYIPEFLEEFMKLAIETGNFDLMKYLHTEHNIPLQKDTIDWFIKHSSIEAIEYAINTGTVRVNKNNIIQAAEKTTVLQWLMNKGWGGIADYTVIEQLSQSKEGLVILLNGLNPIEQVYHIVAQVNSVLLSRTVLPEQIKPFLFNIPEILAKTPDPSDDELIYIAQCQNVKKEQMMDMFKVYDSIVLKKSKINMFPSIKKYLVWYVNSKKILNKKLPTHVCKSVLEFL